MVLEVGQRGSAEVRKKGKVDAPGKPGMVDPG